MVTLATLAALPLAAVSLASAPPAEEPPLPHVRGPQRWEYRSSVGRVIVHLREEGVQGRYRAYTWVFRTGLASMREPLHLGHDGLFITGPHYRFTGIPVMELDFPVPELIIGMPLQVGTHWQGAWQARTGGGRPAGTARGLAREWPSKDANRQLKEKPGPPLPIGRVPHGPEGQAERRHRVPARR